METHTLDWSSAYREGLTPWDLWGATPALEQLLARGVLAALGVPDGARIAVPGCGRGHDVRFLSNCGYRPVGFDLAPEAVREARQLITLNRSGGEVLVRDVLGLLPEFEQSFDLVYEYTCFCALPPHLRSAYARTLAGTLVPGGRLLALAFPMHERFVRDAGPPHLVRESDLKQAFGAALQFEDSFEPAVPGSLRGAAERWFTWRKPGRG